MQNIERRLVYRAVCPHFDNLPFTMLRFVVLVLLSLAFLASLADGQVESSSRSFEARTAGVMSLLRGNSLLQGPSGSRIARLIVTIQDRIAASGGCPVNACFGLDGSGALSSDQDLRVREFIQLVVATVGFDDALGVSGYYYGLRLSDISPYTQDINAFLLALESTVSPRSSRAFLTPFLFQCNRDFQQNTANANRIAVFTDPRSATFGSLEQTILILLNFLFGNSESAISVVDVGPGRSALFDSARSALSQGPARGSRSVTSTQFNFFDVAGYDNLLDILEAFTMSLCNIA